MKWKGNNLRVVKLMDALVKVHISTKTNFMDLTKGNGLT